MEIRPTSAASAVQHADPKLLNAALGFEQLLVQQLAETLVASAQAEDEENDAASAMYRQMLPDALSESVKQAGGIGLASQLAKSLSSEIGA
jgi:Rod binding domain-containing protein